MRPVCPLSLCATASVCVFAEEAPAPPAPTTAAEGLPDVFQHVTTSAKCKKAKAPFGDVTQGRPAATPVIARQAGTQGDSENLAPELVLAMVASPIKCEDTSKGRPMLKKLTQLTNRCVR